jgi:hypothetical protein
MASKETCMAKNKWWRVSWKRVGLTLLLIFVGLWLLYPLTMDLLVLYFAHETAREHPLVALVPQLLTDTRRADLRDGVTVSRFGYSLQVPWTKVKAKNDLKTVTMVDFDDGSRMLLFDPATQADMVSQMGELKPAQAKIMREVFSNGELTSHYDFAKATLEANPTDISIFHSRTRNTRTLTLLETKFLYIVQDPSAIYSVSAGRMRGFQSGDPQKSPMFIQLFLFDPKDHMLQLILNGPRGSTQPVLTQEQINAIIASVRPPD